MMSSSFRWKKKRKLDTEASELFAQQTEHQDECSDWLTPGKLQKLVMLEDNESASRRLREQGGTLADNERYWEAIKYWTEALELTPDCAALHEMKSQVLLELGEVFPAVQSGERAVSLDLTWSTARLTLGRAQLGIGELEMALSNFQKALHLDPTNYKVCNEDIAHTLELIKQRSSSKFSSSVMSVSIQKWEAIK